VFAHHITAAAVTRISCKIKVLVIVAITVIVSPVADLEAIRRRRASNLTPVGDLGIGVEPALVTAADITGTGITNGQGIGGRTSLAATTAMVDVAENVEAFVSKPITVVVDGIADLEGGLTGLACILTPIGRVTVYVQKAVWALIGLENTDTHIAYRPRVAHVADLSAPTAMIHIGEEIVALVDGAVTVVIHCVTRLFSLVGDVAHQLASILRIAISVGETGHTLVDDARPVEASHLGIGQSADIVFVESPAPTAIVDIGILVDAIVDNAVAVVIEIVTDLDAAIAQLAFSFTAVDVITVPVHETRIACSQFTLALGALSSGIGERAPLPTLAAIFGIGV